MKNIYSGPLLYSGYIYIVGRHCRAEILARVGRKNSFSKAKTMRIRKSSANSEFL